MSNSIPASARPPEPPGDGGLLKILLGLGIGAAAMAVLLIGVEVATGYGLRGLIQNKAKEDAAILAAKEAEFEGKLDKVRQDVEAANRQRQVLEERILELTGELKTKDDRYEDRTKELKKLEGELFVERGRIADAIKRAKDLEIALEKLKKQNDNPRSPQAGITPPGTPVASTSRAALGAFPAPLPTMTVDSKPVGPAELAYFRRSGGGVTAVPSAVTFSGEPTIRSAGLREFDPATAANASIDVTGIEDRRTVVSGRLTRSGRTLELNAASRNWKTPLLQTGFVEVAVAGTPRPQYCIAYSPPRLAPQAFERSPEEEYDSNWVAWRSADLRKALTVSMEDYEDFLRLGGRLGFAGPARVVVDGATIELTAASDAAAALELTNRPNAQGRPLAGEATLALDDRGHLVLKTARASAAKTCTVQCVALVRPLAKAENLRTDRLLVFEIHPRHAVGAKK